MASDPASGNVSRSRPDSIYVRHPTNRMGVVWMLRSTFDRANRSQTPELAVVREALAGKRPIFAVSRTDHDLVALLRIAKEFKFSPTIVGGQEAYKLREELAAAKLPVILGSLSTNPSLTGTESSEVVWNLPSQLHDAEHHLCLVRRPSARTGPLRRTYGLPPEIALGAITQRLPGCLDWEKRVGTIEPERDADLLALDGDPLELTTSVRWVLVDGTIMTRVLDTCQTYSSHKAS